MKDKLACCLFGHCCGAWARARPTLGSVPFRHSIQFVVGSRAHKRRARKRLNCWQPYRRRPCSFVPAFPLPLCLSLALPARRGWPCALAIAHARTSLGAWRARFTGTRFARVCVPVAQRPYAAAVACVRGRTSKIGAHANGGNCYGCSRAFSLSLPALPAFTL